MRSLFFGLILSALTAAAAPGDEPDLSPPPVPPPAEPEPTSGGLKVPMFSGGAAIFGIQYGPGLWAKQEMAAARNPSVPAPLINEYVSGLHDNHTLTLRLGYNILGHASIEVNFVATGWNVFNASRGGAGFLTGIVAWHPLELMFIKKKQRPFGLDFSTYFGAGFGIAGGPGANGVTLGSDGLVLQWGLNAEYWFNRFIALGAFVRGTFLQWKALYLDYDNRTQPGNTLTLPQGIGGGLWQPGLEVMFRFGE